jgi:hypothetical protein
LLPNANGWLRLIDGKEKVQKQDLRNIPFRGWFEGKDDSKGD